MAHLYLLLKRFDIERGQALQVDMQVLLAHKWQGNLEIYLNGLDRKLMQFVKEPDPYLLLSLVEPELRKAKEQLAPEIATYHRAAPGSQEKSLKFLVDFATGYSTDVDPQVSEQKIHHGALASKHYKVSFQEQYASTQNCNV